MRKPDAQVRKEQPGDATTCQCIQQIWQLCLVLLKLKSWRCLFIVVPVSSLLASLYILPMSAAQRKSRISEVSDRESSNDKLKVYGASDFAALKLKFLADRSAFPNETAAAARFLAAEFGDDSWINDCSPESDCRESFIHRSEEVGGLISYSKSPREVRHVLECIPLGKNFSMRCAFLYGVMVLSVHSAGNPNAVKPFKDLKLFELRNRKKPTANRSSSATHSVEKYDEDKMQSLPESACADWIRAGTFKPIIESASAFTTSLAVTGVNFYLLVSTISCIRILKTGGFLRQQFRNGLSVSVYWLAVWMVTSVESVVLAGVFTLSNSLQCRGVFPASLAAKMFAFFVLLYLNLAAVLLLIEILAGPFLLVAILTMVFSMLHLMLSASIQLLMVKAAFLMFIFPSFFSSEFMSQLFTTEANLQFTSASESRSGAFWMSEMFLAFLGANFLLILLATYLDFVMKNGNGLLLPLSFPVTRTFWCPPGEEEIKRHQPVLGDRAAEAHIEPVLGLTPSVVADRLHKTYRSGSCCRKDGPAVLNNLSCIIYRGQITALIGHNGAGKSTLIKILTGEELPDSGSAYIAGCLVTDPLLRLALRGRISICPQFDVLCDSLTVMECVRVTLVSRAVSDSSQLDKARKMLQRLGLGDKENVLSCDLSGGQKRKVNTILALLGDPDVVFLDEPTSGLDPVSRRQLWQLLQEEKSARSIVLCTQFMDEADILADRKIFLCGGKIVCAGSSMFLKRAFGCSFTLSVSLKSKTVAQSLLAKLKQVRVKSHHETELQLEVPALNSAVLTEAVQVLETSAEVETFGLSQASLDDVFMRLGGMDSEDVIEAFKAGTLSLPKTSEVADVLAGNPDQKESSSKSVRNSSQTKATVFAQLRALFITNIRRQVRVWSNLISRFLVPSALLLIMCISSIETKTKFKERIDDPILHQMDIFTNKSALRVDDFGREKITTVCVADLEKNYSVELLDNCKKLALPDSSKNAGPRDVIILEKTSQQNLKEFLAEPLTRSTLFYRLSEINNQQEFFDPFVVYYSSTWQQNVSNKDRSVSISVVGAAPESTVHIYRRALVKLLNLFGIKRLENTTSLALLKNAYDASVNPSSSIYVLYIVFSLFPVSYLSDPIEDMTSRVRSYLISTGMTHLAYWVNTFVMHWAQYAICYATAVGMMMISEVFRSAYLILAAFLPVFILGIVSNLLTVYVVAVLTKTKNSLVSTCCVLSAVLLTIALSILPSYPTYWKLSIWILPPFAPLSLLHSCSVYYFAKLEYYQTDDVSRTPGMAKSVLINPIIYHSLLAMPVHIAILLATLCLSEKSDSIKDAVRVFHRGGKIKSEKFEVDAEEGAKKEAERVLAAPRSPRNVLEVRQLHKIYPNGVHAVRGLTFGAMAGEIFGLLGANGAGKSTSMSVIVGEEAATEGVCEVRVHDGAWVSGREGASVGAIGYCPQHNPLFDSITVTEHVRFYADIRGLDSIEAERQTTRLIRSLGLEKHSNKQAGQLSGGNKRRLCLAIALLGDPALIIIDEASTGVDPENKRFIWGAIRRMTHKQRSVMVTTHSMEEVEALCGRVGIMNNGRMISVGSVQQLRSRYGEAYTLELLLPPEAESAIRQKKLSIKNAVSDHFKGAQTQEDLGLGLVMQFSVPKSAVRSLSDALKWLADSQSRLGVSYWALYQMSLDQVFVKLVRMYDKSTHNPAAKSPA